MESMGSLNNYQNELADLLNVDKNLKSCEDEAIQIAKKIYGPFSDASASFHSISSNNKSE